MENMIIFLGLLERLKTEVFTVTFDKCYATLLNTNNDLCQKRITYYAELNKPWINCRKRGKQL